MYGTAVNTYPTDHDLRCFEHEFIVITADPIPAVNSIGTSAHVFCNQPITTLDFQQLTKRGFPAPLRIRHRITKHLQKHRLQELVELGDGLAALGAQGVGLVQDGGDAALFGEGWEGNPDVLDG